MLNESQYSIIILQHNIILVLKKYPVNLMSFNQIKLALCRIVFRCTQKSLLIYELNYKQKLNQTKMFSEYYYEEKFYI